tara:strand:- start:563 stop:700 length:138 start_codon:yes stop_codon:yes gene_type:complete
MSEKEPEADKNQARKDAATAMTESCLEVRKMLLRLIFAEKFLSFY